MLCDADLIVSYIHHVLARLGYKVRAKRGANMLTINGLRFDLVPARPGWVRKFRFSLLEGGGPLDWKPPSPNFLPPFCFEFVYPPIPFLLYKDYNYYKYTTENAFVMTVSIPILLGL